MVIPKTLEITCENELDNMALETVSDYMEQNMTKYSIGVRNWCNEYPYQPITAFAISYSKQYIYVNFFVHGNYLRAVNYENNSPVHQDSCVEFFLQIPGSKEYWNFEFNCIGTIHASHRESKEVSTKLTDEELARVKRYASCGNRPFEEMEGMFAWNLLVAIPLDLIGLKLDNLPTLLKGNFYKCGDKTSAPHFLSWSPIELEKPFFHCPQFFGNIIFK